MRLTRQFLDHIIVGFRFEKSFRIGDVAGEICDLVLHDKSTPFGTDFFPRYQDTGIHDRALVDSDRKNFLRITTSDIIFQYTLQRDNGDQEEQLNWIKKDAVQFIVDKVIHGTRIRNIMRAGIMIGHIIEGMNLGGSIISRLTGEKEGREDQFSLTFGRKDTAIESLFRKNVNDYTNKLFLIKQISEEGYDITFDYQYYFNPPISDLADWSFGTLMDRSLSQLENTFYPFVNLFMAVAVG